MDEQRVRQIIQEEMANFIGSLIKLNRNIKVMDGHDFILGTGNGTKFGTASDQKIGLFGATPVDRAAAISVPSAFSGLATGLGGTPYAAVADLNTLRTAVSEIETAISDIGISS